MEVTTMSTIREMVMEINAQGAKHPIFKEMEKKLGYPVIDKKPQVALVDWHNMAVVVINENPVGIITIDWSEPCLEFKPLAK